MANSPTELLARLVSFDTTSAKSNLPLIAFVGDYLAGHGVESTLVPSTDGAKASLFATIGPKGDGGIGLSGHSDCVPVDGQAWTSGPFTLRAEGGKLYGRGTCDMKGFIACVLAAVPRFKERTLTEPVHILISYDEEVGCTGVRPLIARLGRDLPHPRAIIVGEPTNMEVIDAHKRIDAYDTTVTGKEAHSGMPGRGVNAIAYAAELVLELERIGADLAAKESDPRFDPPYSTVQVGVIQGGTAGNIVPKTCRLQWQVRSLPSVEAGGPARRLAHFAKDSLLPRMHRAAREAAIETVHGNSVPAFQAAADSTAVGLALELAGREHTCAVSYTTEAGLFEKAGVPSVVCGPGSAEQAHAADEFVTEAQLKACMTFLDRLAAHCGA